MLARRASRSHAPRLLAALLAASCLGCGAAETEQSPPSFVLYVIDTLRRDRIGAYGYDGPTTPYIDRLARDAVVFDNARSAAPWTLPSVVSLLTSSYTSDHRVVEIGQKLGPDRTTLPERLQGLGYRTAAFVANPLAASSAGLERGSEFVEKVKRHAALEDVETWLDEVGDQPFFLYLHTMEPHRPYVAPDRFARRFDPVDPHRRRRALEALRGFHQLERRDWENGRPLGTTPGAAEQKRLLAELSEHRELLNDLYDAGVAWADENLEAVAKMLRQRGAWRNVHVIVLSDHGEEWLDHGGILHGQSLYDELVAVPFIWKLPDGGANGRRVAAPASLIDVMPTLLDFAGDSEPREGLAGRSLRPLLEGAPAENANEAERVTSMRINRMHYFEPFAVQRGHVNVAVVSGSWKGIWNVEPDTFELYDLEADPMEQDDVSDKHPEVSERLQRAARARYAGSRPESPTRFDMDQDSIERLRELGYIN